MVVSISHRSADMRETETHVATEECVQTWAHQVLNRRPAVGLAVSVIRGDEVVFNGHGLSDLASDHPITKDTIFRIGSITKTITAVAVMQLWERGLIDLDAPAEEYLRAYRLVPADSGWRPVTIRHLLTHTAGIPDVLHIGHLFHPSWGPFEGRPPLLSVEIGDRLPSLAEYYREGIPVLAEPGSAFAYSNHGFATLGQIVEEVSEQPLDRYFRQHIFEPLGMMDTDLVRTTRIEARLARGYDLGSRGATPVTDRQWIGAGGGGVYSPSLDMVRYAKALLGGGSNEHGSVLSPATVTSMFDHQYQADPRLGGVGLAFFRHDIAGHRVLGHDGILPGFNSSLLIAPDDGVGVVALTNGSKGAMAWLPLESERLLRQLVDIADDFSQAEVPQHPEIWDRICGRYRFPPVADLRGRLAMGGGAEVRVIGGRLMIRFLTPMPALYRGFPLIPDDSNDPYAFRVDLSRFGMGPVRLAFRPDETNGSRAMHTDLGAQPISMYRRPSPRRRILGWFGVGAALAAGMARRPRTWNRHRKASE